MTSESLRDPLLREYSSPVAWVEFSHSNGRGRAALTSFLLGATLALVPVMILLVPSALPFCVYFALLICFHMSEYLLTAAFRPDTLSFDNFLLNHSTSYQAMIALCWVEYWAELLLLDRLVAPGWKQWGLLSTLGLIACLVGLCTRALGMATASTNFSHRIEERKRQARQFPRSARRRLGPLAVASFPARPHAPLILFSPIHRLAPRIPPPLPPPLPPPF